ncbi:MAG TPA: Gfo/Idh/MocA family oxidoreductase [Ferruginibacter sp.]|nr:Gfo/Idh/MocA family oxidoreductase [Ferruginibacter sp.]HMP20826.1 Gfo/Idh/MocA family oxidoreductase [Ferruginibacter sp.]
MKRLIHLLACCCIVITTAMAQHTPLKIAVIGLTHTHVHWILGRPADDKVVIVGIVETNTDLAKRYTQQHGLSMDLVYASMDELIQKVKPDAVTAFGTIYDHLEVVEKFAPLGIHVMVEKPLAVNMTHAKKMQALAKKYGIHLLTNYETTWYPTVHAAVEQLNSDSIGNLTQLVIRDGHKGPLKIGVNKEFLEWLTDPVKNGGGAITDFGCYGANIATWILKGEKPLSVIAVKQQLQKENNPEVDDESTIILTYKNSKATIQASWNWPIGRKDMEVYGTKGVIYADTRNDFRIRFAEGYDGYTETKSKLPERPSPYNDPFAFFAAVINKEITLPPYDLSSLENNMIVVEILDAARLAAKKGKAVRIK